VEKDVKQRKKENLAMMPKTILSSLPRTIIDYGKIRQTCADIYYADVRLKMGSVQLRTMTLKKIDWLPNHNWTV